MTQPANSSSNVNPDGPETEHTEEALEDLAAESIALPVEKLEAIRRKYGFPQAWYNEDSKPF